jgi:small ligand-binding sensory domain FIST
MLCRDVSDGARKRAGVASSLDESPERAGLLAASEAAATPGRDHVETVLVFASGRHAASTLEVAVGAAEAVQGANVVVLGGVGFSTAEGEEARTGVAVIALDAPSVVVTGEMPNAMEEGEEIGREMGEAIRHERARPMLFFTLPNAAAGQTLAGFAQTANAQAVLGGGLSPSGNLAVRVVGEAPRLAGAMVALRLDGGYRLAVGASTGVKPLSDFSPIEEMDGGFVTELGGQPPLDALASVAKRKSLVLAMVEREDASQASERVGYLVRGIGGVDPRKKAIYVGDDVSVGDRLAFATPNRAVAREDFQAMLRDTARGLSGGVAVAGFHIDCAGRGARLYGRQHVDARAIAARFDEVPFAGIRSSFEIAPHAGIPEVLTYTGVLGLLYAPS